MGAARVEMLIFLSLARPVVDPAVITRVISGARREQIKLITGKDSSIALYERFGLAQRRLVWRCRSRCRVSPSHTGNPALWGITMTASVTGPTIIQGPAIARPCLIHCFINTDSYSKGIAPSRSRICLAARASERRFGIC